VNETAYGPYARGLASLAGRRRPVNAASDDRQEESLAALAAPGPIGVRTGGHGAKCGEKDGISWGSRGVPPVTSGPAMSCDYVRQIVSDQAIGAHLCFA
jgi:hypothetical protein